MKILITGENGFVGTNLREGLTGDYQIFAPSSKELNLTDYGAVSKYLTHNSIEIVVHAAVHSALANNRDAGLPIDLRMFASLSRNLDNLKKIIVFGSGAEFAKTRDLKKVKEDEWGEYLPEDPYGLSKYVVQEVVRREPKMVNLRLFGVYGPSEDYRNKFISNAIVKNLLGLPIRIKQDVIFDYLYISDLAPIVSHFISHDTKHHDYNVTPTQSISLSEIAKIINDVSDFKSPIEIVNPGMNFTYTGDNNRLLIEINDLRFTSYKIGIMKLIAHYSRILGTLDCEAIKRDEYLLQSKPKEN